MLVIIPIRGRMTDNRIKPTITDRIMTRVGSRMAMMDCSLRLVFPHNDPLFFENHIYVTAAETDRYHLGIQVVENASTGQSLGKIGTGINGFLTAQDLLFHFLVAYQSGHHIQAGIGIHTAA